MTHLNPKAWVEAVVELIWRVGLRLALWVGAFYILYRVRSIVVTIVLAAVLTYMVLPLVDGLCAYRVRGLSRKLQRFGATIFVFTMLVYLVALLSSEFSGTLLQEFRDLAQNSHLYLGRVQSLLSNAQHWYQALPPDAQAFLRDQNFEGVVSSATAWASRVVASTIEFFLHAVEVILIPVLAFYFTLDSRGLKREFVAVVPRRRAREALAIIHELNCIMRNYVVGQIVLCVIAAVVMGVVMHFFGMPYVLLLSVFAGVTRAVPVIGPIVSGIVIILIGMTVNPLLGVHLLVIMSVLHFVESKFIMPLLIGDRMQLHPVVIIVALLIGSEFFGIFGMFMAAPVASLVKVLVRYYLIKPRQLHVWGLAHPEKSPEPEETIPELPLEEEPMMAAEGDGPQA